MDFTRAAIEKNRITFLGLLVVFLAGYQAYRKMPRAEDPGFLVRTAVVTTYFPGASPERVEQLVTDKLEKVVQEIPQLDYVNSESRAGVSIVYVNIQESYKDLRPIWDDLRRKVDSAAGDLPAGVRGPYVNDEFGDVYGIYVAVTGEGLAPSELHDVAEEVRDQFLRLDDVAKVDLIGGQAERVFVEFNNARLAELGLTPGYLVQLLQAQNIINPGGSVDVGGERIQLEPTGNFETVADLARTVIGLPGSSELVYLEDVARVYRDYVDPPQALLHADGEPAIGLAVSMRAGGNIITLGEQVDALMRELEESYPIGIGFHRLADQPARVSRLVDGFVGNLLQSVAIVALVMLFALGLRTGLVVATLIPGAILMSFLVMSVFDIGIDQISLASLIIALGMLVDNAIVMSESILVQMAAGKQRVAAAVDSARELKVSLLTSSLTTSAAFLPIFLAKSSVGEYTAAIFEVVTITLLSSWVLALTMIPLFCVLFLKVKAGKEEESLDGRVYRLYRAFLIPALKHPFVVVVLSVLVFLGSLQLLPLIPKIFFPPDEQTIVMGTYELPAGTDIERSIEVAERIDAFIAAELRVAEPEPDGTEPELGIVTWGTHIGTGAPRFLLSYNPEPLRPELIFQLIDTSAYEANAEVIERLERFCFESFPDLSVKLKEKANGQDVKYPVEVRVSGPDEDRLFAIVDQVKERLGETSGVKSVVDDWGAQTKKLIVDVNQERARLAGVSSNDVAISLQTALSGIVATEYREGEDAIPVTLRSGAQDRLDFGVVDNLFVYSQATGVSVPLKQVADVRLVWSPSKIKRRDRYKTVTAQALLDDDVTAVEVVGRIAPWLEEHVDDWGLGYSYAFGGEAETSEKANESILANLPTAFFLIVLLLVGQFNSVRRPLIVLLTIPLGFVGVVLGLLAADSYFGFMTLLGVVSLSGIVINNAIVLLDRIRIEIEDNHVDPPRAVIEAAQRRLRPILLTTCTTVGGLVPLWLGGGAMWEPMAISIIFGLLFATVLTLGFVPVMYAILFRVKYRGFRYS